MFQFNLTLVPSNSVSELYVSKAAQPDVFTSYKQEVSALSVL